jgi:hypothetical protein
MEVPAKRYRFIKYDFRFSGTFEFQGFIGKHNGFIQTSALPNTLKNFDFNEHIGDDVSLYL